MFFVDDLDAQGAGFFQLTAGVLARDHKIDGSAYRRGDLAAAFFDELGGLGARVIGKAARKHYLFAAENPRRLLDTIDGIYADIFETVDNISILRLGKELNDALRR